MLTSEEGRTYSTWTMKTGLRAAIPRTRGKPSPPVTRLPPRLAYKRLPPRLDKGCWRWRDPQNQAANRKSGLACCDQRSVSINLLKVLESPASHLTLRDFHPFKEVQ